MRAGCDASSVRPASVCAIGISSLRADKLTDELVGLLARGGYRTLTVAADGASERMRRVVERSTKASHLLRSAELARAHRLHTLKVYMMLGVPGETDADVDELVALSKELAAIHPRVAYGVFLPALVGLVRRAIDFHY